MEHRIWSHTLAPSGAPLRGPTTEFHKNMQKTIVFHRFLAPSKNLPFGNYQGGARGAPVEDRIGAPCWSITLGLHSGGPDWSPTLGLLIGVNTGAPHWNSIVDPPMEPPPSGASQWIPAAWSSALAHTGVNTGVSHWSFTFGAAHGSPTGVNNGIPHLDPMGSTLEFQMVPHILRTPQQNTPWGDLTGTPYCPQGNSKLEAQVEILH